MSAYLQRLYDTMAGTAVAPEARPAQRSSSPLLAVDQRLASPAYVASFLLGLPGSADPDLDAAPPEPDLLTRPAPTRRAPSPAPEEGSAPLQPPAHVLPATPQPQVEARVVPSRGPGAAAEPTVRPAAEPRETPPAPRPHAHDAPPAAEPARPPAQAGRGAVEEPLPPADRRPLPVVERQPQQVVEPTRPQQPARLRVVHAEPPLSEQERKHPAHATPPPMLHPAPANEAEPLPPPPAPRIADQADLADQVRRLVREAIADGGSVRRASRDQPDVSATSRDSERAGTASPARTAEARSVIGPLGRPDRTTTLYGLRLR